MRREEVRFLSAREHAPTVAPTEGTTIDVPAREAAVPVVARRVLGGRYEIRGVLGRGGMGEVWLARDMKLQVDVALKIVRSERLNDTGALDRLRAEVRAARAVASPHVCRVYDLVEAEGLECISMEYVDGTTLREILATRTPLDLDEAREIALQFLAGLGAIHDAGLVHRDVKPENVMRTRAGRVVLMDFGIAKAAAAGGTIAGTPAYWPPEQAAGAPANPRADIFAAGLVLAEMVAPSGVREGEGQEALLQGLRADPPKVPDTPWAEAIRKAVAREPGKRYDSAQAFARALEEIAERVTGTTIERTQPYPGLSSFTEADARFFFGREAEIEAAWKRLPARHLLAVVGSSGAGKSSFLRAGVIPAKPDGWAHIVCTPGDAPFVALGQALVPEISRDTNAMRQMLRFDDADVAVDLFRRWRGDHPETLVILDQFEELFTLNASDVQARFASLLGRLVLEADVHVLLSMRDDFLLRCQEHDALKPVFSELMPLGAPVGDSLRRALVQPALKCGYRFEDEGLVSEMLLAVEGERGALPLLAFAANELWQRRDRERGLLTRAAYGEIGGVGGALAQHAEATLERVGTEKLPIVREIFRNLVTAEGTRAVRDVDELLTVFPADKRVGAETVLKALVDTRLLTSYEAHATEPGQKAGRRVEVVHESLLAAWPRLVRWRTEDEAGAQIRDQLRQAARLWDEKGRTNDLLWTGTAFQEFEIWRGRYAGALTSLEDDFAKAMAVNARRKRRLVQVAAAAVVAASLGVAIAVGISRHKAVVAARMAEASKLLAFGQERLAEDPTEALAYATASLELSDTWESRLFAVRALALGPPAREMLTDASSQIPAFSPEGHYLAVGGHSADVEVWKEDGGPPVRLAGHETIPRASNFASWASDSLLVTGLGGDEGRRVSIWSMPAGAKLRTIDFGSPTFWQVGNGRLFGQTEVPSSPRVFDLRAWRLPDGEPEDLGRVDGAKLGMTSDSYSCFEPNGRGWLYTVGKMTRLLAFPMIPEGDRVFSRHAAEVAIFRILGRPALLAQHDDAGENRLLSFPEEGPPVISIFPKPESAPPDVWFTESGRWVRGDLHKDGELRLWNTTTLAGVRPLELRREGSWYAAKSSFHPAGRFVVATTHMLSRLTLWPVPQRPPIVIDGYKNIIRPLAFSPDGRWLATSWPDARLRLWPLPGSGQTGVKDLNAPADIIWTALAFDPKGKFLFAVGNGDDVRILPLDGSPGRKLDQYSKDTLLYGAAVSPTGRRVATAFSFGKGPKTLRVWETDTQRVRVFELPVPAAPPGTGPTRTGFEGGVETLAFLDDSTVFTGGDGGIRRWNLDTGKHELIRSARRSDIILSSDRRELLFCEGDFFSPKPGLRVCGAIDLSTGASRDLPGFGKRMTTGWPQMTTQGPVFALLGGDGSVAVGLRSGGDPHLLMGHAGMPDRVAISPDLRWVASTGGDHTIRLWPMPDLSKPPLHTLPQKELLAKLKSLTNIRAVRDSTSGNGWKIDLGPFPGWKDVPTWQP